MRRLPIYFIVDVSENNFEDFQPLVYEGIKKMLKIWRQNPYFLELIYISQIHYNNEGCSVSPFRELYDFNLVTNNYNIENNIKVLDVLMKHIEENVEKTTPDSRGDYKPLIVVFSSDSDANRNHGDIMKWASEYRRNSNMIVFDLGDKTNSCYIEELEEKMKFSLNMSANNVIHINSENRFSFIDAMDFLAKSYMRCAGANISIGQIYEYNLEKDKINITYTFKHP